MTEQTMAVMRARNKAFRWPKGTSGNPSGQSRFYHEARKLAREAAPEMMKVLIGLARDTQVDERVRSVCAVAVLDRGGVKPIDKPEVEPERSKFDPRAYSPKELRQIEEALLLVVDPARARAPRGEAAVEVPGSPPMSSTAWGVGFRVTAAHVIHRHTQRRSSTSPQSGQQGGEQHGTGAARARR